MPDSKAFVAELMRQILDGRNIPKLQVERYVSPILGVFLPDVLTETRDNRGAGGRWHYRMLCPEFPLKKAGEKSNQSTNVDWLLYRGFMPRGGVSFTSVELVFVELKTVLSSFSPEQATIYLNEIKRIESDGAGFLLDDIELNIRDNSREPEKYDHVAAELRSRFPGGEPALRGCKRADVIYLVPGTMKAAEAQKLREMGVEEVLFFSDLKTGPSVPHQAEWSVIMEHLRELDAPPRRRSPHGQD